MSVVVDLGCYDDTDAFSSINELIEAFQPEKLIGFDVRSDDRDYKLGETIVQERRGAAWIYDGLAECVLDGTGTHLGPGTLVPCVDFSHWIKTFGPVAAVKMDIEGAEYGVLEKMHDEETDSLVGLLIIEWHGEKIGGLRCPTVPWWN